MFSNDKFVYESKPNEFLCFFSVYLCKKNFIYIIIKSFLHNTFIYYIKFDKYFLSVISLSIKTFAYIY